MAKIRTNWMRKRLDKHGNRRWTIDDNIKLIDEAFNDDEILFEAAWDVLDHLRDELNRLKRQTKR